MTRGPRSSFVFRKESATTPPTATSYTRNRAVRREPQDEISSQPSSPHEDASAAELVVVVFVTPSWATSKSRGKKCPPLTSCPRDGIARGIVPVTVSSTRSVARQRWSEPTTEAANASHHQAVGIIASWVVIPVEVAGCHLASAAGGSRNTHNIATTVHRRIASRRAALGMLLLVMSARSCVCP